jgi:excisionase family DNA binding protein
MNEFEKLYTVEDIAKMTGFTSRTIRNYLKDGSLQGRKIGGQWRFTMENIKGLFNNGVFLGDISRKNKQRVLNFLSGAYSEIQGKLQVCTIVDCYCESQKEAKKIYDKLVTVINTKVDDAPAKFDYEFSGKNNKARFTLFGNPEYIVKTLRLLE